MCACYAVTGAWPYRPPTIIWASGSTIASGVGQPHRAAHQGDVQDALIAPHQARRQRAGIGARRRLPGGPRARITRAVPAVIVSSVSNHSRRISASWGHSSLTVRSSAPCVLHTSTHCSRLTRMAASASPCD